MRTLKKVLALTVVLATLLSISAFAAFSDEESINENFVDAVNLLGALNVMTGDTEGTFRPTSTISRAEAAKMIYVIRNGGVDDKAEGWTGMSTFSDVTPGVWYEGYVNYCASIGIIDGIGGGLFNPSGAVTGVELAKMMLVVADYRSDVEGYTGAGWNLNVIRDAQTAGMFKGYTLAYSAAATREQAAQLFANAILETEMAVYIGDVRVNSAAYLGSAETVGGRFFDLAIETGVLTKVPHVSLPIEVDPADAQNNTPADVVMSAETESVLNANDEMSTISAFNDNDHLVYTDNNGRTHSYDSIDFEFAADPDLLYQEVNVIYQEANEGGILDRKSKVYAVLPTGNSDVYETTMDAITLAPRKDDMPVDYALNGDGVPVTTDAAYNPVTLKVEGYNGGRAKVMTNGYTLPVVTNLYNAQTLTFNRNLNKQADWDKKVYIVDPEAVNFLATTSTAPVRLIDIDHDGNLDVAFVTTPYYGTVKTYDPARFDFSTDAEVVERENITSERDEDIFVNFTFEDELKKDDVIALTLDVLSGEMKYTVSLVEPVVGNLTHVYATDPDNAVTIGGETYGFYGLKFDGEYLADEDPVVEADAYNGELGTEVTVYTDGKYIISAYVEPATIGDNFAFVSDYNTVGNSFDKLLSDSRALLLELVLPDGEVVVKEYDRDAEAADGVFEETALVDIDENDPDKRTATDLLKAMLGNIVEVNIDGDFVTIEDDADADLINDEDLKADFHGADKEATYNFNSETDIFSRDDKETVGNAANVKSFAVDETSVFFLAEYKDGTAGDEQGNIITDVTVINGDELRGTPDIVVKGDNTHIMQLITALQAGVRTAAYGVLDPDSDVSEGGLYAYSLSQDWDQKDDDHDGSLIYAVLSDVEEIDDQTILELGTEDHLANKVYRAFLNADGTYDFEEVVAGEPSAKDKNSVMELGSIEGVSANGNRVTIDGSLYVVTDDTQIFVVNTKQANGTRIDLGDKSDLDEADTYLATPGDPTSETMYQNVLFEAVNGNELSVVYVEAAGDDLESLVVYREEAKVDMSKGDLELPMLTHGAKVPETLESAKFTATFELTPDDATLDSAKGYTLKITLNAKPGVIFADDVTVTLPEDYPTNPTVTDGDDKQITVEFTLAAGAVKAKVTPDVVEEIMPEVTMPEFPDAEDMAGATETKNVPVEDNALVTKIELTYEKDGAAGADQDVLLKQVKVTLSDEYKASYEALTADEKQAVVDAIAAKLGLTVSENVSIAAASLNQAPAVSKVITAVAYDKENGVLTLTIGKTEPVTFEFKTAGLHDNAAEGGLADDALYAKDSYRIGVTKTEEDHYTVTFHATDLKEHENQYNQKGYWVGVQVTTFSENVKGWVLDYQGKKVDFEDSKYILHSWDSGEKPDFSALYLKADKHDGYVAGIQLLDDDNAKGNVLKTVYITFDMSGVEIYKESISQPDTGDDAGNNESLSQQNPSDNTTPEA